MSAVKSLGLALALAACAGAHIGSPDVFYEGNAGPYRLLVVVRAPNQIPGTAALEVRALDPGVERVELTPTPMTGEAAKHPPMADIAARSAGDPRYFTGAIWLMTSGSWQVHVRAFGSKGAGELPVPISAVALKTAPMDGAIGLFLLGMLVFLGAGMVAIVGAAVRESRLEPGAAAPAGWDRRSLAWMAFTAVLLGAIVWAGKAWWADDAAANGRKIFRPLGIEAALEGGNRMQVRLVDPGWLGLRKLDDIVPDHGHLMHLFLVRWPDMGEFYHLHPDQNATGFFSLALPSLPAGHYRLYADIVHESGFAETALGELDLPAVTGVNPEGDDAGGRMPGDASVVWLHDAARPIRAREPQVFRFAVQGPDGPEELEPYMGMAGHAEFVKQDGSVFAHVHPSGTVPMASAMIATPLTPSPEAMMAMHRTAIGKTAEFPYGLPTPGRYRVFVQLRKGSVRTGAFDLDVLP